MITGPVFEPGGEHVGDNRVAVPKYLYKLVFDVDRNRAWAHWQENGDETQASRPISYEELVRRTGINFLPSAGLVH